MNALTSWLPRLFGGWGTKAAVPSPVSMQAPPHPYGLFLQASEITPTQAWLLYKSNANFAKIVDLIADNVASLMPIVKIDGDSVPDHPAIRFLAKPGFRRNRRRLIKEIAVQYLVTGTAYLHVYGNVNMPPHALDVLKSKFLSAFPGADGWPQSFLYAEMTRTINFHEDGNPRDPRYIDMQSGMSELVPIYDLDGDKRGVGLSRINAIRTEVELRLRGLEHNTALLTKGARLSGVLSFKEPLDEDQQEAVKADIRAFMQGSANAGAIHVTSGGDSSFTPMSQNAKDMDFVKLMEQVEDAMVARYNIPITLYRTTAQTDNNYETAWNVLYDQAVLPCFEVIYSPIAAMLSQRLGVEIQIEHDALTNPILARQASARARDLHSAQLISKNEARDIIGMEPVLGGDTILGPMGMVPIAEDMFTTVDVALGRNELDARQTRLAGGGKLNPARQIKPKEPASERAKEPSGGAEKPTTAKEPSESTRKSFEALEKLLVHAANNHTGVNGHAHRETERVH
jgi:phage portal protein BeeE